MTAALAPTLSTDDEDPHAAALAALEMKSEQIRYAAEALPAAKPADVMAWLAGYGVTVSRSKVSPIVRDVREGTPSSGQGDGVPSGRAGHPGHLHLAVGNAQVEASPPSPHLTSEPSGVPHRAGDGVPTVPIDGGGHPGRSGHRPRELSPLEGTGPGAAAGDRGQGDTATWDRPLEQRPPLVAFACYAVAVVSLLVSLNTSWRFFDSVLHIPTAGGERLVMFAVGELALVVCGAGMAVNVHCHGRPGAFRLIVWAMCAAMAYMAWAESTPQEAFGRILLGPLLGTVMLHLGLGLELRARHHQTGTLGRIGRELRERVLARIGLADDGRDAAQRIRDRKAARAAALARPQRWPGSRQARLERALLAAGVADDPIMRDRLLARLAVVSHAGSLAGLRQADPWI
ncbi:hypothetical protein [[Mycobacterium] vasticus]|uniref:DUF2637 domain-containing protein n=1 Tax=[Mycobacterium] vasticus TaxID=2875777 RepID=A0ABU5Z3G4_9MYCO|nr:hypothetical protein [Mycolicibacter sp. MYC017]MEB3071951.1 hypothetical protein [Mycolicibacter sp. MYC017]